MQGIYYYYYVRWVAIRQQPGSEVCYVRGGLGARTLGAPRCSCSWCWQLVLVAQVRSSLGIGLFTPVAK